MTGVGLAIAIAKRAGVVAIAVLASAAAAVPIQAQTPSSVDQLVGPACIDIYSSKSKEDVAAALRRHSGAAEAGRKQARAQLDKAGADRNANEGKLQAALSQAEKAAADAKAELSKILSEKPDEADLRAAIQKDNAELARIKDLETALGAKSDELKVTVGGAIRTDAQRDAITALRKDIAELKKQIEAADKPDVERRLRDANAALDRKTYRAAALRAEIPGLDAKEREARRALDALKQAESDAEALVEQANALTAGLESCAARRAAELDPQLGPVFSKADALLSQVEAIVAQLEGARGQIRAKCAAVDAEPGATNGQIDALTGEIDALASAAAAQKSATAEAKMRAELARKARDDAAAAFTAVSETRGQAEASALAACERAQSIVSNPGAADAQAKLQEARGKQAEAEQAVARAGHGLNIIRASLATARAAGAPAAAGADLSGQLASLQGRLDALAGAPARVRALSAEIETLLKTMAGHEQSAGKSAAEFNALFKPYETEKQTSLDTTVTEYPPVIASALAAYTARAKAIQARREAAKAEKGCAAAIEAAAKAIEQKLAAASAKLKAAETDVRTAGVPAAPPDYAAEIQGIYDAALPFSAATASIALNAVTCTAAAQGQIQQQAGADTAALESKKRECAAQFGRASAVWNKETKQASCICEAGYFFTNDGSKCTNDSEFAQFANGECAKQTSGAIAINRNAKAQTYACGCNRGWVMRNDRSTCVNVATFNQQAAQQCQAQLAASVVANADPGSGQYSCQCPGDLVTRYDQRRCVGRQEILQQAANACGARYPGATVLAETINYNTGASSCACTAGLAWNPGRTACVDPAQLAAVNNQLCEQRFPNTFARYNPANGNYDCICKSGYVLNSAGQCVNEQQIRAQAANQCRAQYPNSVLTSFDINSGRYMCGCTFGWVWNGSGCSLAQFTPPSTGGKPTGHQKCYHDPKTGKMHCG